MPMMTDAVSLLVAIRYCINIILLTRAEKSRLLLERVLYLIPRFLSTAALQVWNMKFLIMHFDMHFVINAVGLQNIYKEQYSFVRTVFVK